MEMEEDYENNFEEDDTFEGIGSGVLEKPVFEEAHYKYAKSLTASQYRTEICGYIQELPFLMRYKRSLLACVNSLFTEEQILANNNSRVKQINPTDPLKKVLYNAKKRVILTRFDSTTYDMKVASTYAIESYIVENYEQFISRTWGTRIERWINPEQSIRNYTQNEIIKTRPNVEQQQPKKKSWFRRG